MSRPRSGIARLRAALADGAHLVREVDGAPHLVRAGYYPWNETIRRAIAVGLVVPAGDGLFEDMPQTYTLPEDDA